MKRLIISMLMAVTMGYDAAAQSCVQADEQEGFNLVALKTSLMVGALTCAQQNQYNTFMTRFQPEILAGQQAMDGYFSRAYGIYAQNQEDTYVTELANSQSEASISMGGGFCNANAELFDAVLALRTPADLQPYTDANPPTQPVAFTQCSVGSPQPPADTVAAAPAETVAPAPAAAAPTVAQPKHSAMEWSGKWQFKDDVMFLVANDASTDSAPPPAAILPGAVLPGAILPGAILPGAILPGADAQNLAAEVAPDVAAQVANLPAVSSVQNSVAAVSAALPKSLASVANGVPAANVAPALHAAPLAKVVATPLAGSVSHAMASAAKPAAKAAGAARKAVAPVVEKLESTII